MVEAPLTEGFSSAFSVSPALLKIDKKTTGAIRSNVFPIFFTKLSSGIKEIVYSSNSGLQPSLADYVFSTARLLRELA